MTNLLEVKRAGFAYRGQEVLNDVSLAFQRGEVVTFLGPNGSGKTTLLKIMLGILQPKTGTVLFEGRALKTIPRRDFARQVAYVPQIHRESFAYKVEEVVLMGRMPYQSFFSAYSRKDRDIAAASMDRLDILDLRDRPYTEISGGERQLTLIARALAQGAGVFIMDEPVNGLDYGNQMRLLSGIKGLAAEGLTFIITTHFPDHALMTADRAILFKDGAVIADGPPAQTITREAIFALYRIDVNVVSMNDSGKVCMRVWAN
ncbi:MAG: ABC transporter ATP-binding protein [Proteobacteria bacterium]|nr:ABC transporter ATP-binding protein [Pseudomonadota bacterium]MBU0968389.1 ABC transporter ATP-binding protein [Pseudomonadota bacterium]